MGDLTGGVTTQSGVPGRKGMYEIVSDGLLRVWYDSERGMCSKALSPILHLASRFYETGLKRDQVRLRNRRVRLPIHVFSIGNIVVGGTGKTPMVTWIGRFLLREGLRPAILSRGFGRSGRAPGRVASEGSVSMLSETFGDEPVILAGALPEVPVWVGRNRAVSGKAAISAGGIDVLLLDDGFQHLSLERDLDIVLLDCRNPFGNGQLLPAGPLREPASSLSRADALVLTHADTEEEVARAKAELKGLSLPMPIFSCRHKMSGFRIERESAPLPPNLLRERKAVAFAGIARPQLFFRNLQNLNIDVCASFAFPDHHRYSEHDMRNIFATASAHRAEAVVTTAKDAVRVPAAFREAIVVSEMEIDFGADSDQFSSFLARRLSLKEENRSSPA